MDTFDGDLSLVWVFYATKDKTSHIQYIIDKDLDVIAKTGLGKWDENKNVKQNDYFGVFVYVETVTAKDYSSGDLIYIAAHCSN